MYTKNPEGWIEQILPLVYRCLGDKASRHEPFTEDEVRLDILSLAAIHGLDMVKMYDLPVRWGWANHEIALFITSELRKQTK